MISQLTVFLENEKGRLAAACRAVSDAGINMHALNLADTSDFGVVRMLTDTPEAAAEALREQGYRATVTPVLAVRVPNVPGGLAKLLEFMDEQDANVEYGYCFSVNEDYAVDVLKADGSDDLEQKLTDAGMGEAHGVVGENLGTEAEAIRYGSAAELAGQSFAPLSVLLVENFDLPQLRAPGFPDESFIRSEVPMTKQEVRAAALAKLAVMPTDTLWDVGAGTGSVSVELALAAPKGRVYAVECEPDACELIRKNRAKFHACNLILIEGRAPDVLADLPAPDAVFIGGTKGGMEAVLDEVLGKNPNARICISAIALETLGAAIAALTARGLTAEVTQIAVSRTKPAGRLHLLMANNPIFLITGTRK